VILEIPADTIEKIRLQGEQAYPEEGAGLLLGKLEGDLKRVVSVVLLDNQREENARQNRYLLGPGDYLLGEMEASSLGLEVLGVFHSHPDHPNFPSEFDRDWAWPVFSYLITSVWAGKAGKSRAWRLVEDRSGFSEEQLVVVGK
jgi:proteasome lid subunit RPN8/RPN11